MSVLRPRMVAGAGLVLLGCGPDVVDTSNVYPRNCGVEGPVDLLELEREPGRYPLDMQRAGDHYLIVTIDEAADQVSYWAVERCGESRVELHVGPTETSPSIEAVGNYLLTCDEDTGVMEVWDPDGVLPPRALPHPVNGCRVVALAGGLALQEKGTGSVWFHADPADPDGAPTLVTESGVFEEWWSDCGSWLDCDPSYVNHLLIRRAGDELLVVLEDGSLIAFSGKSGTTRIVDEGPVAALDVLGDGVLLVVEHHLGPTHIVNRETGDRFEFCCAGNIVPTTQLGEWIVRGSRGSPSDPEPPQWTVFRSYHLPSGTLREIEGRGSWTPRFRLAGDSIVVDISDEEGLDPHSYVVWPATGERQAIELPGVQFWTFPGRDGAYIMESDADGTWGIAETLRYLPGPDQSPEVLARNARIVFATCTGRTVYLPVTEPAEPAPLSVLLPNHESIEIEPHALGAFGFSSYDWPIDENEVVYVVEEAGHLVVRRTVLP